MPADAAIDVPIIDLDRDPDEVGREIDETLREVGFFQIVGHGVSDTILDAHWNATRSFFDLPLADKLEVERAAGSLYGYFPVKSESLAQSLDGVAPGDLKESFNVGPVDPPAHELADAEEALQFAPPVWPGAVPEFRPAWEDYYRAMSDLSSRLLTVFARGLDLPADYFAPYTDRGPGALRAINYPEQSLAPEPGQLRAGAHTDYGTLTILRQELGQPGLQVRDEKDGGWVGIPPVDGAFVVNIGDLMARWTNDRWTSTLHRVVNPDADSPSAGSARRQSIPFFHNANYSAVIECLPSCLEPGTQPRYAAVVAGPHLASKYRKSVVAA